MRYRAWRVAAARRRRDPALRRVRVPAPLIGYRVASGRGASEQPNAGPAGEAELSARFWGSLLVTAVGAGLFGIVMTAVLVTVQHLAYGYATGTFTEAVVGVSDARRVLAMAVAALVGGVGWYLLRRVTPGQHADADNAVWTGTRLDWPRSLGTSVLSEVVIGLGASLGREAAPKLMGAVSGELAAQWGGLSAAQRRLLVACGAGAGLSVVYNVPIAGALFTAEVLLGSPSLLVVLPALVCSGLATLVGWLWFPAQPVYSGVPDYPLGPQLVVFAILVGPMLGAVAVVFVRLIGTASFHRARGRWVLVAPWGALGVLALCGLWLPQLFGNGKGIASDAFLGQSGVLVLLALAVLKPLVTALCLGSGMSGGLLTPTLSIGAALGGALGLVFSAVWPGAPAGAYALIGAAALLGAAMQAPLTGLVIVVELIGGGLALSVPMVIATATATLLARRIDGYSIYSVRLPAHEESSV
ncbi:MAG: chloride channel protein [Pseudonocardia sp.]|nr:chloride channel protein [Pseudonocardia sp.]